MTALSSSRAAASTVLFVTDQVGAQKAREASALLRATKPFSLMKDLKLKVIQTSTAKLGCNTSRASSQDLKALTVQDAESEDLLRQSEVRDRRATLALTATQLPPSCDNKSGGVPTRLISCDTPQAKRFLQALKLTEKAKYVVVVKTDSRYGGSGGEFPVITTGSPAAMAMHELMHRLGFADEYGYYTPCEADLYCPVTNDPSISPSGYGSLPKSAYNVTSFASKENYSSNASVRSIHAGQIPWLTHISSQTDLVNKGKLGTPKPGVNGLYRAIVCDLASKKMETWQSTSETTLMKSLATTNIPTAYWPVLAKSLGTTITN